MHCKLITQTQTQSLRVRHCVNTEEDRKGHNFPNTRTQTCTSLQICCGIFIWQENIFKYRSEYTVWCAEFVPSAPMDTSLTPLLAMKSSALLTLLILWTLILPLSGLGNLSPAQKHEELSHAFHRISTNTNPRLNISSAPLQCLNSINELEASGWMKEVCRSLTWDDL